MAVTRVCAAARAGRTGEAVSMRAGHSSLLLLLLLLLPGAVPVAAGVRHPLLQRVQRVHRLRVHRVAGRHV